MSIPNKQPYQRTPHTFRNGRQQPPFNLHNPNHSVKMATSSHRLIFPDVCAGAIYYGSVQVANTLVESDIAVAVQNAMADLLLQAQLVSADAAISFKAVTLCVRPQGQDGAGLTADCTASIFRLHIPGDHILFVGLSLANAKHCGVFLRNDNNALLCHLFHFRSAAAAVEVVRSCLPFTRAGPAAAVAFVVLGSCTALSSNSVRTSRNTPFLSKWPPAAIVYSPSPNTTIVFPAGTPC